MGLDEGGCAVGRRVRAEVDGAKGAGAERREFAVLVATRRAEGCEARHRAVMR
jgi:hypothetical protein